MLSLARSGIANGLLAAWASLGLWQRSLGGWRGSDLVGCNAVLSAAERSQVMPVTKHGVAL